MAIRTQESSLGRGPLVQMAGKISNGIRHLIGHSILSCQRENDGRKTIVAANEYRCRRTSQDKKPEA